MHTHVWLVLDKWEGDLIYNCNNSVPIAHVTESESYRQFVSCLSFPSLDLKKQKLNK